MLLSDHFYSILVNNNLICIYNLRNDVEENQ